MTDQHTPGTYSDEEIAELQEMKQKMREAYQEAVKWQEKTTSAAENNSNAPIVECHMQACSSLASIAADFATFTAQLKCIEKEHTRQSVNTRPGRPRLPQS